MQIPPAAFPSAHECGQPRHANRKSLTAIITSPTAAASAVRLYVYRAELQVCRVACTSPL